MSQKLFTELGLSPEILQAVEKMGFEQASKLMVQSGWCGSYLAVLEPGNVQAGDAITLIPGPREVSVRELFRARARA